MLVPRFRRGNRRYSYRESSTVSNQDQKILLLSGNFYKKETTCTTTVMHAAEELPPRNLTGSGNAEFRSAG